MGAQIAAHLVNVRVPVVLFDLPDSKTSNKNGIVSRAVDQLRKLKPSPLGVSGDAELIQQANYEEHMNLLGECDLVIEAIAEARSHGDLSENAEYDAAKEKQAFIEGRIQELEGKLAAAQIIDPSALDVEGRIVFGATVELEDLEDGKTAIYQIVGDDEADLETGKISISSPIARALIGKEEGDVATVNSPGGSREVEILSVNYV